MKKKIYNKFFFFLNNKYEIYGKQKCLIINEINFKLPIVKHLNFFELKNKNKIFYFNFLSFLTGYII